MLTYEQLDEIKTRASKATAGPWDWNSRHGLGAPNRLVMWPSHEYGCDLDIEGEEADLDFIAHARQDIPDMIAALEASEAARVKAEQALRTVQNAAKTLAYSRDSELQHLRENGTYDHKLRAEHDSLIDRDALMTDRITALEQERDALKDCEESAYQRGVSDERKRAEKAEFAARRALESKP